ncbi:MAG: DUF3047 domain-containing protein [Candidatus Omnitrophota bacterium]|nr:DUF3047 domain-containing protein [Candidatus Omnitrophota bacterium]
MKQAQSIWSKVARLLFLLLLLVILFAAAIFLDRYNLSAKKKEVKIKEAPPAILKYKTLTAKFFPFSEENSLKEWEEKIFKDRVVYRIERSEGSSYVRANSKAAASALYYKIKLDAKNKRPVISWKWRVEKFPDKTIPERLEADTENDFAAHVYVIFPAMFFTNSKVLEYVWAEDIPVGSIGTSPYSRNIKLMALRAGPAKEGRWFDEERDIEADYMRMFGRAPEYDIGAIAFMTNAEHTGTTADAMYDNIRIGYRENESQ